MLAAAFQPQSPDWSSFASNVHPEEFRGPKIDRHCSNVNLEAHTQGFACDAREVIERASRSMAHAIRGVGPAEHMRL